MIAFKKKEKKQHHEVILNTSGSIIMVSCFFFPLHYQPSANLLSFSSLFSSGHSFCPAIIFHMNVSGIHLTRWLAEVLFTSTLLHSITSFFRNQYKLLKIYKKSLGWCYRSGVKAWVHRNMSSNKRLKMWFQGSWKHNDHAQVK